MTFTQRKYMSARDTTLEMHAQTHKTQSFTGVYTRNTMKARSLTPLSYRKDTETYLKQQHQYQHQHQYLSFTGVARLKNESTELFSSSQTFPHCQCRSHISGHYTAHVHGLFLIFRVGMNLVMATLSFLNSIQYTSK